MTTLVHIRPPFGNHQAVRVQQVVAGVAEDPVTMAVLGHGDTFTGYVHDASSFIVSEAPLTEVQPKGALTLGQRRAGVGFNPGGNPLVDELKARYASLIDDLMMIQTNSQDPEVKRMAAVAITELQTSQMWAVKAATWRS